MFQAMFDRVMDFLFGCRHQELSRPFTIQRRTYKVCLDCGRELGYSLRTMSVVSDRSRAAAAPRRQPATILTFQPRVATAEGELRNKHAAA